MLKGLKIGDRIIIKKIEKIIFVFLKPMCKVVYMKTSGHTSVVDYCLLFTVDVSTQGISYPRSVHPDRIFIGSRVFHRLEFWDVFQASRDTKRNTPTRKPRKLLAEHST